MLKRPIDWNIGLRSVCICRARIIKRGLSARMVLQTIRPYRIFRFVAAASVFMCAVANG